MSTPSPGSHVPEIFSLRLVVADFYLEKPIHGLDTCYSEHRGSTIGRVVIIYFYKMTFYNL